MIDLGKTASWCQSAVVVGKKWGCTIKMDNPAYSASVIVFGDKLITFVTFARDLK